MDELKVFFIIDQDTVHFFGQEIAHRPLDQPRLAIKQDRLAFGSVDFFDDRLPASKQDMQVAHEPAGLFSFARGTDDDTHAFGNRQRTEDVLQPFAFRSFFDLT